MGGVFWIVTANGKYWADRPTLFRDIQAAQYEAQKRGKEAARDGIQMTFDVAPIMVRTIFEWEQREELIRDLCFKIDVLQDELNRRKD